MKLPFINWRISKGEEQDNSHVALAQARQQAERAPENPRLRLYLVSLLLEGGDLDGAVKEWHAALLLLPFDQEVMDDPLLSQDNAWSHYLLGCILSEGGAQAQALAEWEKAASLDEYGVGDLARAKLKHISW